jgi:hypothetical protein
MTSKLPIKSPPSQQQIDQWVSYVNRKIEARKFAMRALVYSDNSIKLPIYFSLNKYEIALYPVEKTAQVVFGGTHRFFPAFSCELISNGNSGPGHVGSLMDLYAALDCVMPLMGFDYELTMEYEMWQDYEGVWLPVQAFAGACKFQHVHSDVPNPKIYELVSTYEALSARLDKRSQKFATLPQRLKAAARQANVAENYGLLAYYNIIEVVADDLLTPSETGKPFKQREKMEKLLALYPHKFNVEDCLKVSAARNTLAHSHGKSFFEEARLCREIALWAAERIAEVLLNVPVDMPLRGGDRDRTFGPA